MLVVERLRLDRFVCTDSTQPRTVSTSNLVNPNNAHLGEGRIGAGDEGPIPLSLSMGSTNILSCLEMFAIGSLDGIGPVFSEACRKRLEGQNVIRKRATNL